MLLNGEINYFFVMRRVLPAYILSRQIAGGLIYGICSEYL